MENFLTMLKICHVFIIYLFMPLGKSLMFFSNLIEDILNPSKSYLRT